MSGYLRAVKYLLWYSPDFFSNKLTEKANYLTDEQELTWLYISRISSWIRWLFRRLCCCEDQNPKSMSNTSRGPVFFSNYQCFDLVVLMKWWILLWAGYLASVLNPVHRPGFFSPSTMFLVTCWESVPNTLNFLPSSAFCLHQTLLIFFLNLTWNPK